MLPATEQYNEAKARKAGYVEIPDSTRATEYLQKVNVPYRQFTYDESLVPEADRIIPEAGRLTKAMPMRLGVSEHVIIKTLLFHDTESLVPYVVLMHGDCRVDAKLQKKAAGNKVRSCDPKQAEGYSGYQVGGTSPFGLKQSIKVFMQESIQELEEVIINGGSKNKYLVMKPKDIYTALGNIEATNLGMSVQKINIMEKQKPEAALSSNIDTSSTSNIEHKNVMYKNIQLMLEELRMLSLSYPVNNLDGNISEDVVYDLYIENLDALHQYKLLSSTSSLEMMESIPALRLRVLVDLTQQEKTKMTISIPSGYPMKQARVLLPPSMPYYDIPMFSTKLNAYCAKMVPNPCVSILPSIITEYSLLCLRQDLEGPVSMEHRQCQIDTVKSRVPPYDGFIQASSTSSKIEAGDTPPIFGKPKGHIKIGQVGLPNVGKSSLFNLLSGQRVPAENYPFCTIDPNIATVPIIDARYQSLLTCTSPKEHYPPLISIVDIAGIVKGASEGRGLGNAFLHHISTVHVIYQVVRVFDEKHIVHVDGFIDGIRDIEVINHELLEKDQEQMYKRIVRLNKPKIQQWDMAQGREENFQLSVLLKAHEWLRLERPLRQCQWTEVELAYLNTLQMWTSKPVCYLLNMNAAEYICLVKRQTIVDEIQNWMQKNNHSDCSVMPISVSYEEAKVKCEPYNASLPYTKEPWFIVMVANKLLENQRHEQDDKMAILKKQEEKHKQKKESEEAESKKIQEGKKKEHKHTSKKSLAFSSVDIPLSSGFDEFQDVVDAKHDKKHHDKKQDDKHHHDKHHHDKHHHDSTQHDKHHHDKHHHDKQHHDKQHHDKQHDSTHHNISIQNLQTHNTPTTTNNITPVTPIIAVCTCTMCTLLYTQFDEYDAKVTEIAFQMHQSVPTDILPEHVQHVPELQHDTHEDQPSHVTEMKCKHTVSLAEDGALFSLLKLGYKKAQLKQFYTSYDKTYLKGCMIPSDTKAPLAAARIHYSLAESFTSCEVLAFQDWTSAGHSWTHAKELGLVKTQSKKYQVMDGDIMLFKNAKNILHL